MVAPAKLVATMLAPVWAPTKCAAPAVAAKLVASCGHCWSGAGNIRGPVCELEKLSNLWRFQAKLVVHLEIRATPKLVAHIHLTFIPKVEVRVVVRLPMHN